MPFESKNFVTVDGERVSINDWARRNNVPFSMVRNRWYAGIRNPQTLVQPGRVQYKTEIQYQFRLKLTPERKKELRELAKYSEGMEEQKYILCDFVPCPHEYADKLMEELGLA